MTTKFNLITAFFHFIIESVFQIVVKKLILIFTDLHFYGIFSLLLQISDTFSTQEMGVEHGMSATLFEPIHKKDYKQVASLNRYFKNLNHKIFGCLCIVVVIVGVTIPYFTNSSYPPLELFLFTVFIFSNSLVGYLVIGFIPQLYADKKQYLLKILFIISYTLLGISLYFSLSLGETNFEFLICYAVFSILFYLVLFYYSKHRYSYLNNYEVFEIERSQKNEIIKSSIGSGIMRSKSKLIDLLLTMVVSISFGIEQLAIFSSYIVIYQAGNAFINRLIESQIPSIASSYHNGKTTFLRNLAIVLTVSSCMCIGFIFLAYPFMKLWMHDGFILDERVVILLGINIIIVGFYKLLYAYFTALNKTFYNVQVTISELLINVMVALILAISFHQDLYIILLATSSIQIIYLGIYFIRLRPILIQANN